MSGYGLFTYLEIILHDICEDIAHVARIDASDCAQCALELFLRGLRWVIRSITRDIRSECREKARICSFGTTVDDLRWVLQGNRRNLHPIRRSREEWRYQAINKQIDPYADNLYNISFPTLDL